MSKIARFLTCGSVDDGKSTMIGKLLFDAGLIYEDQLASLKLDLQKDGKNIDTIDYSFLLDGLISEREQGITIDVAYRYFSINNKKYIVADTPGHSQYTKNMATGASHCASAIILIDARKGLGFQTRRHALICALMGINKLLFAVNKFDLVNWSEDIYDNIRTDCTKLINDLSHIGLSDIIYHCIPISALLGDNLLYKSDKMTWYNDITIYEWLDNPECESTHGDANPEFIVQYVIKSLLNDNNYQPHALHKFASSELENFRAYAGKLISGQMTVGQNIKILSSEMSTTVKGIIKDYQFVNIADEGDSLALILEDDIDISRGDIIISPVGPTIKHSDIKATVIWMDKKPLRQDEQYIMKSYFGYVNISISSIDYKYNLESFKLTPTDILEINEVGTVILHCHQPYYFETYQSNKQLGSFIIIDRMTNSTVGCGLITTFAPSDSLQRRTKTMKNKKQFVLWFTGLSGSGKTTTSELLKSAFSERGHPSVLLDGDMLRQGICRDLDFTDSGRTENIRRTAEIAKLILHSGVNVLCSLISPFRRDRQEAREILSDFQFIEIFVNAPLDICEQRDTKGFYKKARIREIIDFTGFDSVYENPVNPEIVLRTAEISVEESVNTVLAYLLSKNIIS